MKLYAEEQQKIAGSLAALGERTVDFTYLIEALVSPNSKLKGAPIFIPEITLFLGGKPKCFIKFDKRETEIKASYSKNNLQLPKLMKMMMAEFRARKRGQKLEKSKFSELSCVSPSRSKGQIKDENSIIQLKGSTMANVRFRGKETALSLSQNEFMTMMMERAGSKQWEEIIYIQNCVVTPKGTAESLIYKYTAPVDFDNPNAEIKYSIADFEEDNFLKQNDIYRFAQKQCTIIGYYLAKIHGIVYFFINIFIGIIIYESNFSP